MNKRIFLSLFLISFGFLSFSQTYYVSSKKVNLRSEANTNSEILAKLSYCDNVELIDDKGVLGWFKVSIDGGEGFVSNQLIKLGKCVKSSYTYRTGARCKDGTRSSATGRGACSHHGGVDYWITDTKVDYRVVLE